MFTIEKNKKDKPLFNVNTIIIKTDNFKDKKVIKPKKSNKNLQEVIPEDSKATSQAMFEIY